jgi:hypothetical protein
VVLELILAQELRNNASNAGGRHRKKSLTTPRQSVGCDDIPLVNSDRKIVGFIRPFSAVTESLCSL